MHVFNDRQQSYTPREASGEGARERLPWKLLLWTAVVLIAASLICVICWSRGEDGDRLTNITRRLDEIAKLHASWSEARDRAALPENASEWELLTAFANAPEDAVQDMVTAASRIRLEILELWHATGYCAFAWVPEDGLVQSAPSIVQEYRRFCERNEGRLRRDVLLDQLESNIELLRTDYCWHALTVVESTAHFTNPICGSGAIEVRQQARDDAFAAMSEWFQKNRSQFIWCEEVGKWTPFGDARGFVLPLTADRLFERASEGGEEGIVPSNLRRENGTSPRR